MLKDGDLPVVIGLTSGIILTIYIILMALASAFGLDIPFVYTP
ncbi:MAG: hypothetical protein ACLFR6_08265 [Salinarchaeum sp.]